MDPITTVALEKTIDSLVKATIAPSIENLLKYLKEKGITLAKKLSEDGYIENLFKKYLESIYKNNSYIRTLVTPNQKTKITDIFVPLSIISSKDQKEYTIDSFDCDLFNDHNKLIIVDAAGMGKSTLLKKILLSAIEEKKAFQY